LSIKLQTPNLFHWKKSLKKRSKNGGKRDQKKHPEQTRS
jgi:hypothetical protein